MDALDALDAVGESNARLVRQVGSDQWDGATPCTEWNVRSLVGHLIMGRHVYRGFLEGVRVAELRLILQAGDVPVAARKRCWSSRWPAALPAPGIWHCHRRGPRAR